MVNAGFSQQEGTRRECSSPLRRKLYSLKYLLEVTSSVWSLNVKSRRWSFELHLLISDSLSCGAELNGEVPRCSESPPVPDICLRGALPGVTYRCAPTRHQLCPHKSAAVRGDFCLLEIFKLDLAERGARLGNADAIWGCEGESAAACSAPGTVGSRGSWCCPAPKHTASSPALRHPQTHAPPDHWFAFFSSYFASRHSF